MSRVVVVACVPRATALHWAVIVSLFAHVLFSVGAMTLPALRGRTEAPLPTMDVALVAPAAPTPAPPVPQVVTPPAPEPEPEPEPEAPAAMPEDPPPEPKPIKPDPEPDPEPEPKPKRDPKPKPPRPRNTDKPRGDSKPPDPTPDPTPALGGPAGLPTSGALEGMGAEFNWYRDAVIRSLFAAWRQPFGAGRGQPLETTVAFDIARNGKVSGVRIVNSSGHADLDNSAFRAVLEASLPPLPRNYLRGSQPAVFVFYLDPDAR